MADYRDARIAASSVALNRLADATRDLEKDNAAKNARIAELEAFHKITLDSRDELREQWAKAVVRAEQAEKRVVELEANQASLAKRAIDATFWANQTGDKLAAANARIASLEKSVTVLREALEPFVKSAPRYDKCADHRPLMYSWTDGETLTVGDLRKARAALAQAMKP